MSKLESLSRSKSESFYHKTIKLLIYKYISQKNNNIVESSIEKYFENRRADLFFRLKNGKKAIVEVQHSKISVKEIIERTKEYNQQGIYVLWILHGKGECVASSKFPEHKKNVKITPTEKFLHTLYGGRVYYVNINVHNDKITIVPPFALHFSLSDNKSKRAFRRNFEYYYFRNSNFTYIPNWSLLCTDFNNFKIARFYDKNIKNSLKGKLLTFILNYIKDNPQDFKNYKKAKQLIKMVVNQFINRYGKHLIFDCINLIKEEIEINEKIINKFKKKR
ncbi:MAG: competence protein CoiA family protein [Promethearchaeota archaeon]